MDKDENSEQNVVLEAHSTIELDLNILSNPQFTKSNIITIRRTDENILEFHTIRYLKEQNENLRKYSKKLIKHSASDKKMMKDLLKQYEMRQTTYDEQIRLYQQTWLDSVDNIFNLRGTIENLKSRLRDLGEEEAIQEIIGDEREGGVPNEE